MAPRSMLRSFAIPAISKQCRVLALLSTVLACGAAASAADFNAASTLTRFDDNNPRASWSIPRNWGGQCPQSAADTGIIGDHASMSVGDPLGRTGNQPIIQLDPGGTLWVAREFDQPLRLNGGVLHEGRRHRDACHGDIEVAADSIITTLNDGSDSGRLTIAGKVWNDKPVTLCLVGDIEWRTDCRSSLSAAISIADGTLYLLDADDSNRLGTGEIRLLPQARLLFRSQHGSRPCTLSNNISGAGSLSAAEHTDNSLLSAKGITLHPGLPGQAGTLAVSGGFEFEPGPASRPCSTLCIEIHGPGTFADKDYSQLVIRGKFADSLDNADLQLIVDPSLSLAEVEHYTLNILTAAQTDITKFKPFHSITVTRGTEQGSAQVQFQADQQLGGGAIVVTGIKFPQ